jgi:hypothetical protein
MDTKKIIYYNRIHAEEFEGLIKTDNYSMVTDDIGDLVILNSASDKTFTLPNLTTTYNGCRIRCSSINTGELKVEPYTGGSINNSEYVLCKYQYGIIEFMLKGTNIWVVSSTDGRIV